MPQIENPLHLLRPAQSAEEKERRKFNHRSRESSRIKKEICLIFFNQRKSARSAVKKSLPSLLFLANKPQRQKTRDLTTNLADFRRYQNISSRYVQPFIQKRIIRYHWGRFGCVQ
jgi:hypothetical protein